MNPYTYTISLGLRHPSKSLKQEYLAIAAIPTVLPGRLMDIGETRTNPNGEPLQGLYQDSRCGFQFSGYGDVWKRSDSKTLSEAIIEVIDRLSSHNGIFSQLRERGGESYLYIGLGIDRMSGEVFKPELMVKVAELGLSLELNFYPSGEGSEST
jgi:hypothetical protein